MMPKFIKIDTSSYARIMFIIKYFMKLHPEYNEILMDFYAKLYEECPIDIDDVMLTNYKMMAEDKGLSLEEMVLELDMVLPSWDDELPNGL